MKNQLAILVILWWVPMLVGAACDMQQMLQWSHDIQVHIAKYVLAEDVKSNLFYKPILTHELKCNACSVAFNKERTQLVTGDFCGEVRIWDVQTSAIIHTLCSHRTRVSSVALNKEGTHVVSASYDGTVRLRDAQEGASIGLPTGHRDWALSAEFNKEGTMIVSAGKDKSVRIWDLKTQEGYARYNHESAVLSASFNSEGTHIVSADNDGTVCIWDMIAGRVIHVLRGHGRRYVCSAKFNEKGTRIVSADDDGTVCIWDTKTGELVHTLRAHKEGVRSVAFNEEGTRIVSTSWDRTVRIWNAKTGAILYIMHGMKFPRLAEFNKEGIQVVSLSDSMVRIWDVKLLPYEQYHFDLHQAIWLQNAYRDIMHSKQAESHGQEALCQLSQDQIKYELSVEQSICAKYPEILERLQALKDHRSKK